MRSRSLRLAVLIRNDISAVAFFAVAALYMNFSCVKGTPMARKSAKTLPDWSRKILAFRQALKLTQGELGKRLRTSAMAVSRWERGDAEPPADAYIRLGNIADDPLCWFFWGRAGLSTADVMRVLPTASRRLRQGRIATVQVVHAGAVEFAETGEFRRHSDSPCSRSDSRRDGRGSFRS